MDKKFPKITAKLKPIDPNYFSHMLKYGHIINHNKFKELMKDGWELYEGTKDHTKYKYTTYDSACFCKNKEKENLENL